MSGEPPREREWWPALEPPRSVNLPPWPRPSHPFIARVLAALPSPMWPITRRQLAGLGARLVLVATLWGVIGWLVYRAVTRPWGQHRNETHQWGDRG